MIKFPSKSKTLRAVMAARRAAGDWTRRTNTSALNVWFTTGVIPVPARDRWPRNALSYSQIIKTTPVQILFMNGIQRLAECQRQDQARAWFERS